MKVRELIDILETYDEDMEVRIGMIQTYGSNFAMNIDNVAEHKIEAFYGKDYKAVVITQSNQCGVVDYNDDDDYDYDDDYYDED